MFSLEDNPKWMVPIKEPSKSFVVLLAVSLLVWMSFTIIGLLSQDKTFMTIALLASIGLFYCLAKMVPHHPDNDIHKPNW